MTVKTYETKIIAQDKSEEYGLILSGLRKYNRAHVEKDERALTIALFEDQEDQQEGQKQQKQIAAGLNGVTYFGWLFVEHLWVREDCRKDGLGKRLVALAEAEALRRGCRHVYLDTFSFQAPGFYEKQGYIRYAKFDDFPGKHSRYFFKKDLVPCPPFDLGKIRLELPDGKYVASYLAAMAEMQSDSDRSAWVYLGQSATHDTPARDFEAYVQMLRLAETRAPEGFVTGTCYWAIYDDQIIGRIAIRHELNEFLSKIGGHIGYIVRPAYRNLGVASEILRLVLQTARARSIGKLLLTCDEDNTASERTILKNGGVFESLVPNGAQVPKKRFWIDLS